MLLNMIPCFDVLNKYCNLKKVKLLKIKIKTLKKYFDQCLKVKTLNIKIYKC